MGQAMVDGLKHLGGRPSVKTLEIIEEICIRLMNGETLREICRDPHLPHRATVFRWLHNDKEFCDQYAIAREIQLDNFANEMLQIADDRRNDWIARRGGNGEIVGWWLNVEHIQRSKIRIETRKWMIAKRAPKRHGSQVEQIDHSTDSPSTRRDLTYRYEVVYTTEPNLPD